MFPLELPSAEELCPIKMLTVCVLWIIQRNVGIDSLKRVQLNFLNVILQCYEQQKQNLCPFYWCRGRHHQKSGQITPAICMARHY